MSEESDIVSASGSNESLARQSIPTAVNRLRASIGASIQCTMPAKVLSYNRTTHKATLQPLVNIPYLNGNKVAFKQRATITLSVWRFAVGGFMVDFPMSVGDTGWIIAADRDANESKKRNSSIDASDNEGAQNPNNRATHQFLYGYFIPDKWGDIAIPAEDNDSVIIQSVGLTPGNTSRITIDRNGNVKISTGSKISIESSALEFKGDATFSGNVTIGSQSAAKMLKVFGTGETTSDMKVGGDNKVTGDNEVGGDSSVTGNSSVGGNSTVTGNGTVGGTMGVTGATTLNDTLLVSKDATLNKNLTVKVHAEIGDGGTQIPTWVQGSYAKGATVMKDGVIYISTTTSNTYTPNPTSAWWTAVTVPTKVWTSSNQVRTEKGECVWYNGNVYLNIFTSTTNIPTNTSYYMVTNMSNYVSLDDNNAALVIKGKTSAKDKMSIGGPKTYPTYNSSDTYGRGAIVVYNNNKYIATYNGTFKNQTPSNSNAYWVAMPTGTINNWAVGTTYSHNAIVNRNGEYFVYVNTTNTSGHFVTETAYWQYIEIADFVSGSTDKTLLFVGGKSYTHGIAAAAHPIQSDGSPL